VALSTGMQQMTLKVIQNKLRAGAAEVSTWAQCGGAPPAAYCKGKSLKALLTLLARLVGK
jgi:hypothetical protein